MGKPIRISLLIIIIIGFASFLNAQGKLTGSITGKVVDTDDNPLPGCSVTIEGPALQGTVSFVCTAQGNFRFPAVPPGEGYQCTFEMPGFKTIVRKGLKVSVGKATNVTMTLEMSALEEEIVVIGESPTVDVKVSKTAVNYSKTYIYNIPLARDLYDVLNATPGSISDDVSFRRTSYIAGGTVRGNQYSLDGVTINDPVVMYPMTNINIDVYEEVEMGLFGHPAEVSTADGGFINIVTKSGGNTFHGGATVEYYNDDMQKSLLSEEDLKSVGLEKPTGWKSWQDFSLFLGGPIIRDRIWFFANGRYFRWAQDFNHIIWDDTIAAGQRVYTYNEAPHNEVNLFGKLTFQLSSNVRLTGSYNLTMITEDFFTNAIDRSRDITALKKWDNEKGHIVSAQLNWVLGQNFFIDARVGYIRRWFPQVFTDYSIWDAPENFDRYYRMYRNNRGFNDTFLRKRFNPSVVATLFQDNLLGVAHEIKIGAEYEYAYADSDRWRENPYYVRYYKGSIYSHRTSTFDNRGRITIRNSSNNQGGTVRKDIMRRFGLFVQDSITIADRLTLNLGIRFDTSKGYFPDQYHAAVNDPYGLIDYLKGDSDVWDEYTLEGQDVLRWTHFSPRVGFSYDLFGDGRTSLRGSWSRYNEYLMIQYFTLVNPFGVSSGTWYWYDNNYNGLFDPPPTDAYWNTYMPPSIFDYDLENEIDKDATAPYTDEFTVGFERELAKDFSLSLTFIYKHKQNIFEDVNDFGLGKEEAWKGYREDSPYYETFDFIDPGDDGEFGTDDDKASYLYVMLADAPGMHYYLTNVDEGYRKYWALYLVLNKRMSNNWQLLAAVVYSKAWGNIGGGYGESWGASANYDTPNNFLFSNGRLNYDRPWNIKLQSTVILPYDFIISAYFNHLSGRPWARTLNFYTPESSRYKWGSQAWWIRSEAIGTRRGAPVTTLDLRLEKRFRIGEKFYVGGYLDIMNAMGRSGYTVNPNPGGYLDYSDPENPTFERWSDYGEFMDAYGTRIFKVSLRLTF